MSVCSPCLRVLSCAHPGSAGDGRAVRGEGEIWQISSSVRNIFFPTVLWSTLMPAPRKINCEIQKSEIK